MGKVIVIVDDEGIQRRMLKGLLEIEGYEVFVAEDGKRGLELVRMHQPDCVVTDIKMPEMDGMTLLKQLKDSYPTKTVIILTGHGSPEGASAALKDGADAYFHKPVKFEDLCSEIKRLV